MNHGAQTVDALALFDEAATGMAGRGETQAAGGEANHDQCCAPELADIAQLSNRVGFGVDCGVACAAGGADTVLADGQDFAAAEQNRDVGVINTGLLGVAAFLGEDVGVQSAAYPGGQRYRRVSGRRGWGEGGHPC